MIAITGRTRALLAGAVLSVLGLGVGATTGLVPRAGEITTVRATAAVAHPFDPADPGGPSRQAVEPMPTDLGTAAPGAEPTGTTEESTPASPQRAGTPNGTAARTEPGPAVAPGPEQLVEGEGPEAASVPTAVPRRQPSAAEVAQAIDGVRPFVRSFIPVNPTPTQVGDLADKICTAFDEGQTLEQVKVTGAELIKKVPFASLREGGADYIVRTGVALYCPGHAAKLA